MCNCFFATKVSFMNEMFQAAQKLKTGMTPVMGSYLMVELATLIWMYRDMMENLALGENVFQRI